MFVQLETGNEQYQVHAVIVLAVVHLQLLEQLVLLMLVVVLFDLVVQTDQMQLVPVHVEQPYVLVHLHKLLLVHVLEYHLAVSVDYAVVLPLEWPDVTHHSRQHQLPVHLAAVLLHRPDDVPHVAVYLLHSACRETYTAVLHQHEEQ